MRISGVEVPEEAKMVVMQEEKFKTYFNLLNNAIREYEAVLESAQPILNIAKALLEPHLNELCGGMSHSARASKGQGPRGWPPQAPGSSQTGCIGRARADGSLGATLGSSGGRGASRQSGTAGGSGTA